MAAIIFISQVKRLSTLKLNKGFKAIFLSNGKLHRHIFDQKYENKPKYFSLAFPLRYLKRVTSEHPSNYQHKMKLLEKHTVVFLI